MGNAMTVKRINQGAYEVTAQGRTFVIEDLGRICQQAFGESYRPDWQLYEVSKGQRQWWNDFASKRASLDHLTQNL